MSTITKYLTLWSVSILTFLSVWLAPGPAVFASSTCGSDFAIPPFLAAGVTPNLLLLIDNSASMYDLAYVENEGECFDDSYDNAAQYAGYFDRARKYAYDLVTGRFEYKTDAELTALYTAYSAYTVYRSGADNDSSYVVFYINSTPNPDELKLFAASGNFLNWVMASKLDIEKEILTGGKYDATANLLILESRGCVNSRFIKQVAIQNSSGTSFQLTLGVRRPEINTYDDWSSATTYSVNTIVNYYGRNFIALASGLTSSSEPDNNDPDGSTTHWKAYDWWAAGVAYPAGTILYDPGNANTIDEGMLYLTKIGGTAAGTSVSTDTGITDWKTYNLTHVEVFPVTASGFDNTPCQQAIAELSSGTPNQGALKGYIDDCMGYSTGGSTGIISNFMAAFNHSIHNCWYSVAHGAWPPGNGPIQNIKPACEALYTAGIDPWDITTDDRGYACFGVYDAVEANRIGYLGRCWIPGCTVVCTKTHPSTGECQKWECLAGTGTTPGGWVSDECIEEALQDYCGMMEIPEVIDPSDQVGETGEFWNLPAVLIDSGSVAQVGQPLAVLKGYIHVNTVIDPAPAGLIQEYTADIRIGAMIFNDDGSLSECAASDPYIIYNCTDPNNRDGGKIISGIGQSAAHTTSLVNALNNIKANSWTPLAEAMYNAIGYYSQNSSLRLNSNDFTISSTDDPIEYWCQNNNILLITEGASTADLNSAISTFVSAGANDADTEPASSCGNLAASSLLDDLTYYANHAISMYSSQLDGHDKQNISTHIVVAGALRSSGTDECSPDVLLTNSAANGGTTLYNASNPSELEQKLEDVFQNIRSGAASGSAASVISSSRGGEGAIYQAIFWPEVETDGGTATWIGEVHSLFVDAYGLMFEDTNGNRTLDEDDERVIIYYDDSAGTSKACFGELNADGVSCNGDVKDLGQVRYIWSAAKWLSEISDANIVSNRTPYISNESKRFIFTWDDLNNDGVVDAGENLPLLPTTDWASISVAADRSPVPWDFGVRTSAEVNDIIQWIRGLDQAGRRNRHVDTDFNLDGSPETVTWRLGDVVHSTPIAVSRPVEGFQFLYGDTSYAGFAQEYRNRRHVIYYGSNDGMIHAVNGGFYSDYDKKFCLTADCLGEASAPSLGAELWGYVPYNLLPHLKCLTEEDYQHQYYVDLRPRIFDVKIFPSDTTHINGWGTIMVVGMRFGGSKVAMNTLDLNSNGSADYPGDNRTLTSSYCIFDITDPENPPTLLGELTNVGSQVDLAYTHAIPTMVPMKNGTSYNWYLIFGSGPTTLDGRSTQSAKIAVLPLDWLIDGRPIRIPNTLPTAVSNQGGSFTLAANSFVSDPITIDFENNSNYMADAVYWGTVGGSWGNWSGKMYRLVTRKLDVNGTQMETLPSEWNSLLSSSSLLNPNVLIDAGQPVTASPTVGTDGKDYWVFFGTGRFIDADDKTDSSSNALQTYYGIKEPQSWSMVSFECTPQFTWETVEKTGTWNTTPGSQGLLQVDQIQVSQADSGFADILSCNGGGTACLPSLSGTPITTFWGLSHYISGTGTGCNSGDSSGTDGWYKDFSLSRERNLGQGALLGGLLTFTTYQPFNDVCLPEGLSFLYGVYFKTGTAWYQQIFSDPNGMNGTQVMDKVDLGRGLSTTPNVHSGHQEGRTDFVQTSTGAIEEIPETNLPVQNLKSGRTSWMEIK